MTLKQNIIMDTGPLVALLSRSDGAHVWVMRQMEGMGLPFITCEAVLSEASYLTRNLKGARASLMEMVGANFMRIGMTIQDQHAALLAMINRYDSVPMSVADACIVRLAELHPNSSVFTLDSDFSIYRKNGRQVMKLITI